MHYAESLEHMAEHHPENLFFVSELMKAGELVEFMGDNVDTFVMVSIIETEEEISDTGCPL